MINRMDVLEESGVVGESLQLLCHGSSQTIPLCPVSAPQNFAHLGRRHCEFGSSCDEIFEIDSIPIALGGVAEPCDVQAVGLPSHFLHEEFRLRASGPQQMAESSSGLAKREMI